MMIRPGDERIMEQTVAIGNGRIRTVSAPKLSFFQRKLKKFSWKIYYAGYRAEQRLRQSIDRSIVNVTLRFPVV